METEVLGNIPRLYTALADWLACLLYLFFLPKRTAGWRRYTIHAVFLLLLGVFMQATGQVPQFWFLPCIAVSILIMYLYIRMQADVPARCAGYYCVRAFILGELAAWHAGHGCACVHFGSRLCRSVWRGVRAGTQL